MSLVSLKACDWTRLLFSLYSPIRLQYSTLYLFELELQYLDLLCQLLSRAADLSREINALVIRLMTQILRWAGRTVAEGAVRLTRAFLTYVLGLLVRPLVSMVMNAMRRIA